MFLVVYSLLIFFPMEGVGEFSYIVNPIMKKGTGPAALHSTHHAVNDFH
jgi:hypothetical protein